LDEALRPVDISQNAIQEALLSIRQGTISVRFVPKVVRAGGNNGQRSSDVVDEKIEQTFLLIGICGFQRVFLLFNIFLNIKPFQKIFSFPSERTRKSYFLQNLNSRRGFCNEDILKSSLDRDLGP
jgi:hypothetical protein